MCDLIYDYHLLYVFKAAIYIKSMYRVYENIIIENQKKNKKKCKSKKFYINLHLKNRLKIEFTAC